MNTAKREQHRLLNAIEEHRSDLLLLLIAFDGVLAEYRDDPDHVVLARRRRSLLKRLQHAPDIAVAIASGRRLSDLRRRADLGDDVFYVALHGLEVVGPDFVRIQQRLLDQYYDRMRDVARQVQQTVAGVSGVRVEFKDGVVALHTRSASSEDAVWSRFQLLGSAAALVDGGAARVVRGLEVLELLPSMGHAKAGAIEAVRECLEDRHHRSVFTVYIGEDTADDDAYEALRDGSVTAVVGRRRRAAHHLNSPSDMDDLLKRIVTARSADQGPDDNAHVATTEAH